MRLGREGARQFASPAGPSRGVYCLRDLGAVQHLAGIRDAGVVVAINEDPEPRYSRSDYGAVPTSLTSRAPSNVECK